MTDDPLRFVEQLRKCAPGLPEDGLVRLSRQIDHFTIATDYRKEVNDVRDTQWNALVKTIRSARRGLKTWLEQDVPRWTRAKADAQHGPVIAELDEWLAANPPVSMRPKPAIRWHSAARSLDRTIRDIAKTSHWRITVDKRVKIVCTALKPIGLAGGVDPDTVKQALMRSPKVRKK